VLGVWWDLISVFNKCTAKSADERILKGGLLFGEVIEPKIRVQLFPDKVYIDQ